MPCAPDTRISQILPRSGLTLTVNILGNSSENALTFASRTALSVAVCCSRYSCTGLLPASVS